MLRNMRKGMSIMSIARELSISRNRVRKYLRSEPKNRQNRKRGSKLDPYREKIRALIDEHNLPAVRIHKEIRKIGYNGGYTILKEYCMNCERIEGYKQCTATKQIRENSHRWTSASSATLIWMGKGGSCMPSP